MIEAIDEATYDAIYGLQEGFKESANKILDKFNKIGKTNLKPEDLTDINKVKAALSKIDNVEDANKKLVVKVSIALVAWLVMTMGGYYAVGDSIDKATNAKWNGYMSDEDVKTIKSKFIGGLVAIIAGWGSYIWALCQKTDYDKLFKAFDKSIYKVDKEIKKLQKAAEPDKKAIAELEKTKKQLIDGKSVIYKKYKDGLAKANNVNEI